MASPKIKLGLIINPIAGMGGKVALKSTDGQAVLAMAREKGAVPEANSKAERALRLLMPHREQIMIYTASGDMGESLCQKLELPYTVVHTQSQHETSPLDTMAAAKNIAAASVDLLLFAGGDGTARNICEAIGESVPVLGIPAGVKIQSAVFALNPESAGMIAATIAQGTVMTSAQREVVDLDEDAYRTGHVSAKLYGVMRVPDQPERLQSMKQSGFSTEADQMNVIAAYLEEHMEPGVYYAIGSGSSAKCISKRLGIDYELLGVDVVKDKKLVAKDVTEQQLWEYAKDGNMKIIVSPIGGQGFVFGRGNHQFSARILKAVGKKNIQIISPEAKLLSIHDHTLHIDCGDAAVNESLHGYYSVLCGYGYSALFACK